MKARFDSALFHWILFSVIVTSLWQLVSWKIASPLICPSPFEVIRQMVLLPGTSDFWKVSGQSTLRALLALVLSVLGALPCAFAGAFCKGAGEFLNRLASLMQTVPNVCYIILLLFWTTREQTVVLTGFFLLFPLIYRTLFEHLQALKERWREVWILYPQPVGVLMIRICLPLLRPALSAAVKSASSLAFKACVTSEIISGLSSGIGRKIQSARFDLNLAAVAAWSLWLVILVFLFEKLWNLILSRLVRSG